MNYLHAESSTMQVVNSHLSMCLQEILSSSAFFFAWLVFLMWASMHYSALFPLKFKQMEWELMNTPLFIITQT